MSIYTIKVKSQKSKVESQKAEDSESKQSLLLLNERGEKVSPLEILKECAPRRVFAFDGQMGAGKTTFIKALCEAMGTNDVVNSPTFAIVNVYDVEQPYKGEVYHFDCYRLKDIREAMDFGAEEYLYSGNYCFIEWPDMIDALLPEDTVRVKITAEENGDRRMAVE
ncbi:MAG: tRNA (adenosine(37)-N6)-threonylcarbamoyltransferase complex ATPase subunit type 1 TsaE [Paludibacteraceae bacterium]|nr:tRNA (adenosine(37)-N6)-threonylcarbamoyltransferase complex ATPase subunit type 1 TsaE [Paludibacteraceae bacterium]